MMIKKYLDFIKRLAEMVLFFARTFLSACLFFFAVLILLIDSIILYVIEFIGFFSSISSTRVLFPGLTKSRIWWFTGAMPKGFYAQKSYDARQAIRADADHYDSIMLRRFLSDWFFLYTYIIFSSGYLRLFARYFGFEYDYFYSILEKVRSSRSHGFNNLYVSIFGERVRNRIGVVPPLFLFLANQREIELFIKSNFVVIDGFVYDFFPSDCSPQLSSYLDLFNATAEYGDHFRDYASYTSKSAGLRHWDLSHLRNRRLISLRVLRYLIFYESFRTYQQGGLQAIRRYRRFCRVVDKVEKSRLTDAAYKKIKWFPYSNMKWFARYLEEDSRDIKRPASKKGKEGVDGKTGTGVKKVKVKKTKLELLKIRILRRRRRRTSTFFRVRFLFRRLGFAKALLGQRRYNKLFVDGDPVEISARVIRSYRRPNFFYFLINLLLLAFCFVAELALSKRDNFYFRALEIIPAVKFFSSRVLGVLSLFAFSFFGLIRSILYKFLFFISIFINYCIISWSDPRLASLVIRLCLARHDFSKLKRLVWKFKPTCQELSKHSPSFYHFRVSARLNALFVLEFFRVFFRFICDVILLVFLYPFRKFGEFFFNLGSYLTAFKTFMPALIFPLLAFILLFFSLIYVCFFYLPFSFSAYRFFVARAYVSLSVNEGSVSRRLRGLLLRMYRARRDGTAQALNKKGSVGLGFTSGTYSRLRSAFNRLLRLKPRPWRFKVVPVDRHGRSTYSLYGRLFANRSHYRWKVKVNDRMKSFYQRVSITNFLSRSLCGPKSAGFRKSDFYKRFLTSQYGFGSSDWYRQENNLPPSFTAYLIKPIYSYKYIMYKRRRRPGVRYRLRHPGFYRVYPRVVQRRFISVPRLFYRHIGRHLKHLFLKYLGYREFVIKPILLKFFRSVVILAKSLFNYKVFMWYLFFVVIVRLGAWSIKHVNLNPTLKGMLIRYRRAVGCFVFLNAIAVLLFNIWRYNLLGRAEFYSEWGDIVMTSYGLIGYVGTFVLAFLGLQHFWDVFKLDNAMLFLCDSEVLVLFVFLLFSVLIFYFYVRVLYLDFSSRNATAREAIFLTEDQRTARLASRAPAGAFSFGQFLFDRFFTVVCISAGLFVLSFFLFYRCFVYLISNLSFFGGVIYNFFIHGVAPSLDHYNLLRPFYFLMYWVRIFALNLFLEIYWFWVSVLSLTKYIFRALFDWSKCLVLRFITLIRVILSFIFFNFFRFTFAVFLIPVFSLFGISAALFFLTFSLFGLMVALVEFWQRGFYTRFFIFALVFLTFSFMAII